MDFAVSVDLPDYRIGDAWIGVSVGPVTASGITQGTLTRVKTLFYNERLNYSPIIFDSVIGADGLMVISTPVAPWVVRIDPTVNFLRRAGTYDWIMQFTHSGDASPITLYKGTIKVIDH